MRKPFLRTPVDFARVSSGFNLKRRHPVLNTIRAHKGVDYAAATGTPIKAAGDGKSIHSANHWLAHISDSLAEIFVGNGGGGGFAA